MEFPDVATAEYAVNIIAENLFDQSGDEGWDTRLFSEAIRLRRDNEIAIPKSQARITSYSRQTRNVITTTGWDVHVKW